MKKREERYNMIRIWKCSKIDLFNLYSIYFLFVLIETIRKQIKVMLSLP